MPFDDEFDETFDDTFERGNNWDDADAHSTSADPDGSEDGFDPMDITTPGSAYLFLSDDAQDEIEGAGRKRLECSSCGHKFSGDIWDTCPQCFSLDTSEIIIGEED